MTNGFDSDAQRIEDERIIVAAMDRVRQGEKLRWPAQKELAAAAVRMAARVSASAPTQDEQDERDDGKDDQDRPQHGDDSTPPAGYEPSYWWQPLDDMIVDPPVDLVQIEINNVPYRVVTPEIQAVLDALPAWEAMKARNESQAPALAKARSREYQQLIVAARAYLASIEPPKPTGPFAVEIADMILRGDSRDEIRRLLNGDPALAIDVVIRLTDKSHRADNVFHYANLVIDILDEQPERTTP